jgi:hypothetical protein
LFFSVLKAAAFRFTTSPAPALEQGVDGRLAFFVSSANALLSHQQLARSVVLVHRDGAKSFAQGGADGPREANLVFSAEGLPGRGVQRALAVFASALFAPGDLNQLHVAQPLKQLAGHGQASR